MLSKGELAFDSGKGFVEEGAAIAERFLDDGLGRRVR